MATARGSAANPTKHAYPHERLVLLARASVARRLVRKGLLDGPLALSYVAWPPLGVLEAERRVSANTLAFRAFSSRLNP